jgi:putative peptidoglycan lipid II flippase
VNVFARAFFALGDTRTPMQISIVCLIVNLVFAVGLVFPLRQGGFGVANTASSTLNCLLLLFALRKKLKTLDLAMLRPTLLPLAGAAIAAGLTAWLGLRLWTAHLGHGNLALRLGEVFVPAAAAVAVYGGIVLALKMPSAVEMLELALSRLRRRV